MPACMARGPFPLDLRQSRTGCVATAIAFAESGALMRPTIGHTAGCTRAEA
jgi:hypothetical protein